MHLVVSATILALIQKHFPGLGKVPWSPFKIRSNFHPSYLAFGALNSLVISVLELSLAKQSVLRTAVCPPHTQKSAWALWEHLSVKNTSAWSLHAWQFWQNQIKFASFSPLLQGFVFYPVFLNKILQNTLAARREYFNGDIMSGHMRLASTNVPIWPLNV